MDFRRQTVSHHVDVKVYYNLKAYKDICRNRWDTEKNRPIENAGEFCYALRRLVNSDDSRAAAVMRIFKDHPRVIIFYNFDYELDILRRLPYDGVEVAEWNGHRHQPIPSGKRWMYFVQYTAGAEGWNCIRTDTYAGCAERSTKAIQITSVTTNAIRACNMLSCDIFAELGNPKCEQRQITSIQKNSKRQ